SLSRQSSARPCASCVVRVQCLAARLPRNPHWVAASLARIAGRKESAFLRTAFVLQQRSHQMPACSFLNHWVQSRGSADCEGSQHSRPEGCVRALLAPPVAPPLAQPSSALFAFFVGPLELPPRQVQYA